MPFIVIALLLAAVIGGGTSFAAQSALPGDALWGFKVAINEIVEEALARGERARADFDISAIELRLQEVKNLVAESKFGTEAKARIESNIASHAKDIQKQIIKFYESGNYAAAADLVARFQAALAKGAGGALDLRPMLDDASNLSADVNEKIK